MLGPTGLLRSSILKSKGREMHARQSHLEISRHESVVYDHHYVLVVLVHQIRAGPDVNHLHCGVGWCFDPHHLHKKGDGVIALQQHAWKKVRIKRDKHTLNVIQHSTTILNRKSKKIKKTLHFSFVITQKADSQWLLKISAIKKKKKKKKHIQLKSNKITVLESL